MKTQILQIIIISISPKKISYFLIFFLIFDDLSFFVFILFVLLYFRISLHTVLGFWRI